MADIKVEKGPGWDWAVLYRWEDGETDVLLTFGVLTLEKAIEEAHNSLGTSFFTEGPDQLMLYDILGGWRIDQKPSVLSHVSP